MKYDKMLMLLTLVAAGLAAGCSDDEDPLKDWTGPSKPGTEIKTPAEVGNRVVAHRGGSTEASFFHLLSDFLCLIIRITLLPVYKPASASEIYPGSISVFFRLLALTASASS